MGACVTDAELVEWLGFKGEEAPRGIEYVKALEAKKRELFERMYTLERDVRAAVKGEAPWPKGVLIDRNRLR